MERSKELRNVSVSAKVTAAELQLMQEAADACGPVGLTLSSWIRHVCVDAAKAAAQKKKREVDDLLSPKRSDGHV